MVAAWVAPGTCQSMDTSILTAAGLAELLCVDPSHVRRMARAGLLTHFKVGGTYRFDRDTAMAELLVAARTQPKPAPETPVETAPRRPHRTARPNSERLDRKRLKTELFG